MIDLNVTFGGTQLKDFLSALVKPLQTNTDLLLTFETQVIKEAHWNGRKIVLQAALNDLFGITSTPFIYIEWNRAISTNTYFYRRSENTPVYFNRKSENDPVVFFRRSETVAIDYDFIVWIPSGIFTSEVERRIRSYTNIYKLAGPSFITNSY